MSIFDGLRKNFLEAFQKHGESIIPFLVNSKISSMVFLSAYKKLSPIEEMPEKEKTEMKLYVRELFPNKTVDELVESAKIVYTIGNLI